MRHNYSVFSKIKNYRGQNFQFLKKIFRPLRGLNIIWLPFGTGFAHPHSISGLRPAGFIDNSSSPWQLSGLRPAGFIDNSSSPWQLQISGRVSPKLRRGAIVLSGASPCIRRTEQPTKPRQGRNSFKRGIALRKKNRTTHQAPSGA